MKVPDCRATTVADCSTIRTIWYADLPPPMGTQSLVLTQSPASADVPAAKGGAVGGAGMGAGAGAGPGAVSSSLPPPPPQAVSATLSMSAVSAAMRAPEVGVGAMVGTGVQVQGILCSPESTSCRWWPFPLRLT